MSRTSKWLAGACVIIALLLATGGAAVAMIPSNKELARRLADKLQRLLGAKVTIGELRWAVWPAPVVVLKNTVIDRPQAIVFDRITVHLDLSALWRKQLQASALELEGASVPQLSLRGLEQSGSTLADNTLAGKAAAQFALAETPLVHFSFRDVTWISRRGVPVVYAGEVDFDSHWRPRTMQLQRPDFRPATDLTLTRQGQEDRWKAKVHMGGGGGEGEVRLLIRKDGRMHLSSQLKPRDVEVSSALQAFNRRPVLAGKASGESTLWSDGASVGELVQSLHTKTTFVMGSAKLLRFDLGKAIKTLGRDHQGQTALDSITGQLDTQNTSDGMVSDFSNLKARSGAFSASGKATLFNRQIDAEFTVDLVDGLVGVPLKVSGPTDRIKVSVPGGAIAGAVIGTALLPVVGTVIGARLGAVMGKLFGPAAAPAPALRASAATRSQTP